MHSAKDQSDDITAVEDTQRARLAELKAAEAQWLFDSAGSTPAPKPEPGLGLESEIQALLDLGSAALSNGHRKDADLLLDRALKEIPKSSKTAALLLALEPVELIDEAMAERHLALLGINAGDPVILCAYGQTSRYSPERQGEKYEWPGSAGERDWGRLRQHLQTTATPNLGFISSPGGTRVKDRLGPAEIFECSLLVYEVDSIPKADQLGLWEKAGLPEPTVVMDTGSKSLHCWYRLAEPVTPEQGREARQRLSLAIDAVLPGDKTTDGSMHSCHQPARLAGGIHPKTGERSTLVRESGEVFDLAGLMALCPELPESSHSDCDGELFMDSDEQPDKGEQFPDLPLDKPFPLILALPRKVQALINDGQKPGGVVGRAVSAWSLSCALQCAEKQLQELGQPFSGSALELFGQFVVASDLYGGDVDYAVDSHWETNNIGTGLMSRLALRRAIRSFARSECGWGECYAFKFVQKPQSDWLETVDPRFFWVQTTRTPELIIQEALADWAEHDGSPLTSYQGRFLQYEPGQGYFRHLPALNLKRQIAGLLPMLYSQNANGTKYRKFSTDAKATACVKWLNTVLNEDAMDVVPGIAFSNGTYLLDQGELVAHSADHRLTWSIDGAFQPGAECPAEFYRFVCRSFGEEWLPIIQRVLRYLVDPTFKPSKLVMILGPSGSGKGTLERLIESLFPPSCISVITSGFADINHPDKIRQFVRGKRLVAFPDLQGRQFGVGTIYSMTDGGLLTSRTLHESEADEGEAFNGRVVICSTQPPSMEDAGTGMTRRMLVLQTLPPSGEPDLDLDDKLQAEKGAIVSWALQADRAEVKRMLTMGDKAGLLESSALQAEVQMDPIRNFIDQCLVAKPTDHIPADSKLFTAFKLFCHDQKHKATAQRTFINRLKAALPHLRAERMSVPGTSGGQKTPAVFFGMGLAEGLLVQGYEPDLNTVSNRDERESLNRDRYREGGLAEVKRHRPAVPTVEQILAGCSAIEADKL
ncbi:primase-like DNA-binding domain-containing protein [Synechococcus sp. A15-60]|uniref:primase-like DNA-binding domain-containing protein n=1 Tax=Synechococcus sp. A15-60 TaxID=1050655 RepID=UPI001648A44C|nr:primase-like DNA-binding domain-containing protein [Synechococcus sp. A15-60]QNI48860.1 hypothetical protein SynA1560_02211 [Synechococcus sp. A15-60]